VSTATYASKFKDVSAEETNPRAITFSSDGTKMYIAGIDSDTVFQYTLGTDWDVSTATYASKFKDVSAEDISPHGLAFSSDGTKMYIMGTNTGTVYQYTVGTAWDVSTAVYASKSKPVGTESTLSTEIAFSSDGTKMYTMGTSNDTVYQYTLGTDWDVSTATYASKFKDVSAEETAGEGLAFSSDGTKMYIVGTINDTVFQYTVGTAWDVSTAVYASKFKDVSAEETSPHCVTFSSDGTKMYIAGIDSDTVFQYTL
jgi:DNA-binding beta-propeller fold protein YncE